MYRLVIQYATPMAVQTPQELGYSPPLYYPLKYSALASVVSLEGKGGGLLENFFELLTMPILAVDCRLTLTCSVSHIFLTEVCHFVFLINVLNL